VKISWQREMNKQDEIFIFLQKSFLFNNLNDRELTQLVLDMDLLTIKQNNTVYIKNEPAKFIYFILQGRVSLELKRGRKIRKFATLNRGDYLGEDCLKSCCYRERAVAMEDIILLKYSKTKLNSLINEHPEIVEMISATAKGRELTRSKNFNWLGDDEAAYMIARKHEFFLIIKYIMLFVMWLLAAPLLMWLDFSSNTLNNALIIFGVLISIMMGIWFWKDWQNDYFVVTNKRVIWFEKTPLLYESRQEAPLMSVLSLKVLSLSVLRLLIDYGNLNVKTYTGEIPMRRIKSPDLMVEFINGLQSRKQEIIRGNDNEVMDAALRKRLGLLKRETLDKNSFFHDYDPGQKIYTSHDASDDRLVKAWFEEKNKLVYRKHWFVLIKKVWLQSLLILGIFIVFYNLIQSATIDLVGAGFWFVFFIGVTGIWIYQFLDWRNDVYIVSGEKIFDIERKPLGRENKKSALLESILSLEHNRVGMIGLLLNYGTVTINIGTEKFQFFNVHNPAQVQNEIFERMTAQQERLEEYQASKERERVADWLAIYHKQTDKSGLSSNSI
jgi:hypothetical protein